MSAVLLVACNVRGVFRQCARCLNWLGQKPTWNWAAFAVVTALLQ